MGAALLRVNSLQDKGNAKLKRVLEQRDTSNLPMSSRLKKWSEKNAMFVLPFVKVLRDGIEIVLLAKTGLCANCALIVI